MDNFKACGFCFWHTTPEFCRKHSFEQQIRARNVWTRAHHAATDGNVQFLRDALEKGVCVCCDPLDGRLLSLCFWGHPLLFQTLLEHGYHHNLYRIADAMMPYSESHPAFMQAIGHLIADRGMKFMRPGSLRMFAARAVDPETDVIALPEFLRELIFQSRSWLGEVIADYWRTRRLDMDLIFYGHEYGAAAAEMTAEFEKQILDATAATT